MAKDTYSWHSAVLSKIWTFGMKKKNYKKISYLFFFNELEIEFYLLNFILHIKFD